MTFVGLGEIHRRILPFTLSIRLITLTTAPSLVSFVQIGTAHAMPANGGLVVAERFAVNDLLQATNQERRAAGLNELAVNPLLNAAAARKVVDMREKGYWDHYRPSDNKAPWDFIKEAGYTYKVAGENLARGFRTVNGITKAWMESPSHRANLLSPDYTEVGFADAEIINEDGERVMLTVQMFGGK
ncbi:MAG TPA: CAP domain-containing protein [Verrucomicrobiae bacterium]|nr:CAP domain-containing protein [Verrucomicrobiae bacterium]